MTDLTARITEILHEHRCVEILRHYWTATCTGCDWRTTRGPYGFPTGCRDEHHAHVAALIAAIAQGHYRPVIETVEQLDALPDDTVVAVGDGCPARKGMGDWYFANDDGDGYPSQSLRLHLPITVLWTPGAGE